MSGRTLMPSGGNDVVMTPPELAKTIINHFNPTGFVLDPCRGSGAFYENYPTENKDFCEISEGLDFFNYTKKVDWIISNFPWSQMRNFLNHSMDISDNVVSLALVNSIFMVARLKDIKEKNFGIKEILLLKTPPKPWPQAGLQLGAIHLQKNYKGDIKLSNFYDN